MNCANARIGEVRFGQTIATHEFTQLAEGLERNTFRAKSINQLIDPTHVALSKSATMASIWLRNSLWRATMWAISALRAVMSTVSRVSSFST